MAKRPRFSRWRRLPPVFRTGEHHLPDPNQDEQRLSLYITGAWLDLAEAQAARGGVESVQEYCARLLERALDGERSRYHVEEIEARHGVLEGFRAITDDPEYLAEWSARTAAGRPAERVSTPDPTDFIDAEFEDAPRPASPGRALVALEPSSSVAVVLRHAGQGGDDPNGFLACLRRGEPVGLKAVAELAKALRALEDRHVGAVALDRRLAYALHRLALESQILHTDAWPGAFDEWTVETVRAVQESVDRILSGQDIRYYPVPSRPEDSP